MAHGNLVHFLRHGHYRRDPDEGDQGLTAIGRRQARRTATRLGQLHVAKLYASDAHRARETAEILARQTPGIPLRTLPLLREMLPTRVPGVRVPLQTRRQAKQRIDELIERFLARPPRAGDTVVVCHGNLIRALLCRLLGTPQTKWLDLGTIHCSFTSFGFSKRGRVRLHCFNDAGHLPPDLRTST